MRPAVFPLLLAALIGAPSARAGPAITDTAENLKTPESDTRGISERLKRGDSTTGARTIDLLIDMQPRGAGLQFNERQPATRSSQSGLRQAPAAAPETSPAGLPPVVPGAAPRVEPPPLPPSGLFGSGATPAVQSARMNSAELRFTPGADNGPAGHPRAASENNRLPAWLLFPRKVIEYVRENRWLVLGSVGAGLLVIWGLSAMFARAASGAGRVTGAHSARADGLFSGGRWGSDHRHETRPTRRHSRRHRH